MIVDATANRRTYRAAARSDVEQSIEAYVDCPLDVCVARDPKCIYRKARSGEASTVPGLQASCEPPEHPDVVVSGSGDTTGAARAIIVALEARGYVSHLTGPDSAMNVEPWRRELEIALAAVREGAVLARETWT